MYTKNPTGKFELGQIVATPGALDLLAEKEVSAYGFLERHVKGDWGDITDLDKKLNDEALINGTRVISSYQIGPDEKIWIITEANRSVTTVLLPEDY